MTLTDRELTEWVNHLKQESQESYDTADDLFISKHYHFALFFCHLALEKIIKANFLSQKKTFAPPIHDLLFLIKKLQIPLKNDFITQLAEVNTFNIRARYEDYKREFYNKATQAYTNKWLKTTKNLLDFFKKKL